ncbi:MAG: 30S ribosomal protein S16 [Bacteroidales bacterium]
MPTKIRLQRHGKKGRPFYHIVIADGRAPRDGRFIEKIGTYNPISKPAEINLDFEKAVNWLQNGAQPTDTVRSILSFKGVMYWNHLLKGVKKGALTEDQAKLKFQEWLEAKTAKVENAAKDIENKERALEKQRIEAERKINEERQAELARRRAAEVEAQVKQAQKKEDGEQETDAAEETKAEAGVEKTEEKA